jgi:hypothetical protein
MRVSIRPIRVALVEVGEELIGVTRDGGAVLQQQCWDLVGSRLAAHFFAVRAIGWDGACDERDAQLGEALSHPSRVRAPFGLVELVIDVYDPGGTATTVSCALMA